MREERMDKDYKVVFTIGWLGKLATMATGKF